MIGLNGTLEIRELRQERWGFGVMGEWEPAEWFTLLNPPFGAVDGAGPVFQEGLAFVRVQGGVVAAG